MTAAPSQPSLGTTMMVENCETAEQMEVNITNQGPSVHKNRRVIALSKAEADNRGLPEQGVPPARVVVTEETA